MASVASASVDLLPTFKGGAGQIERVMGPHLQRAGVAGGQQYGNSFAGAVMSSPAFRQLAAAGGVGAILFGGFDRLRTIDDAQGKLRGLGNDATQIASVTDSALKAVQGTAFGLGDAATIAASAMAAGVGSGEELTRYLKLVANTAAVTGDSLMSVGNTLNNVRTLNAAYNDSLQILSQKGLPVYQLLAEQIGVTTAEVKKLASEGKISAAELEQAIAGKVGSAAKEMGKSFSGVLENLQASFSRTGANLLGGDLQGPTAALTQLTEIMKDIEPVAKVIGDGLGSVIGVLGSIPAPVYATVAAFVALRLATRSTAFGNITSGVTGAVASFKLLRLEAQLAGSSMPGLTAGLAGVASAGRSVGPALLGAFGGPVGLAITGVSLAVGGLIAAWQAGEQAAAAQKSAVDALTASLEANTGAATASTIQQLSAALAPAVDDLELLGLRTEGLTDLLLAGGPALDQYRAKLQSAFDSAMQGNLYDENVRAQADAADRALKIIDSQISVVEASTKAWGDQAKVSGVEAADAVESAAVAFDSVKAAVDSAFAGVSSLGAETDAIRNLAQSVIDNGKAINTSTAGGIANLEALQSTISAMATASGGDYTRFANQVGGLMVTLQQQGVNTQGVMGAVRAAVENVAGKRYGVFLDGSQAIAEANRVILSQKKMLVALQVARAAAIGGPAAALTISFAGVAMAAFDAAIRGVSTSAGNVGSTFRGVSQAASGAGKAAGRAASGTRAAGKSARETAADLAALRSELYATARAWLAPSPMSSEASSLIDQINGAYSDKAISRTTRGRLVKAVTDRDRQLRGIATSREKLADQIDDANGRLQDAIEARTSFRDSIVQGFRELGDLTRFAEQTEKTVTESFRQGDRLYNVSKVVKGVSSAKDMVAGLREQVAQAKKFKDAFTQLDKLGLNDTSLQNLMSQFLSSGDAGVASSLLAGGKSAVNEVNGLMQSLTGLTGGEKGWAAAVAQDMFGAGVNGADGYLRGLKSKDKALDAQYKSISSRLLSTIKKDLGIRSPSRKMAELAGYTSDGWNQNLHLDPVTPDVAVPGYGSAGSAAAAGPREVRLVLENGRELKAYFEETLDARSSARAAALRGGRR